MFIHRIFLYDLAKSMPGKKIQHSQLCSHQHLMNIFFFTCFVQERKIFHAFIKHDHLMRQVIEVRKVLK